MASEHAATQLSLRIDLHADPISGSIGPAGGGSRRFTGWIGLAGALEQIRAEQAHAPSRRAGADQRTPRA